MKYLELSDEQLKALLVLLDKELRSGGLESLVSVVDLYNLLLSAREVVKEAEPVVEKAE